MMNNDDRQKNDFAARLDRINAGKGISRPRPTGDGLSTLRPDLKPIRDPSSGIRIRNFFIWCGIAGVVGLGGFVAYDTFAPEGGISLAGLSDDLNNLSGTLSAVNDKVGGGITIANGTQPARSGPVRSLGAQGWTMISPALTTPDMSELLLTDYVAQFPADPSREPVATVTEFDPNDSCTLRKPLPSETVMNVRLRHATQKAPLSAFGNEQLATIALGEMKSKILPRGSFSEPNDPLGQLKVVDVFVTETSAPVYLVLQIGSNDTLWNVHPAEGVEIAHIAMIGQTSALSAPAGITYEALRIGDFVLDPSNSGSATIGDCTIKPWRNPQPHWGIAQQATGYDKTLNEHQMDTYANGYTAFNAWYQRTLGVDAATNLTSAETADHILTGPLPQGPLPYSRIGDRDVKVTRSDNIVYGPVNEQRDQIATMRQALVLAATGGNLDILNPPALEAATQ